MRTFTNRPGVLYDSNKTDVLFAEDLNELSDFLDSLAAALVNLESGTVSSVWFTGAGAPDVGTGTENDFYLDTLSGDVYKKVSGAWGTSVGNIKGPQGPAGPASTVHTVTYSGTPIFDIDTNGALQYLQLSGTPTLSFSCTTNRTFAIILEQDATGSRTVTWPAGISWDSGSAPTLSTGAGKKDTFVFVRIASGSYLGFVAGKGA